MIGPSNMLPFVPRSVAGVKRRAPQPGGVAAVPRLPPADLPHGEDVVAAESAARLADALVNWLSPWWCARRDDSLARLIQGAQSITDMHVAHLLADPFIARLGCKTSAEALAAAAMLEPLGVISVRLSWRRNLISEPRHLSMCA